MTDHSTNGLLGTTLRSFADDNFASRLKIVTLFQRLRNYLSEEELKTVRWAQNTESLGSLLRSGLVYFPDGWLRVIGDEVVIVPLDAFSREGREISITSKHGAPQCAWCGLGISEPDGTRLPAAVLKDGKWVHESCKGSLARLPIHPKAAA